MLYLIRPGYGEFPKLGSHFRTIIWSRTRIVVSKEGDPNITLQNYHHPLCQDPQKGTPNSEKPPDWFGVPMG